MVTIFRQVLVTTSQHHKVHLTVFFSKPIIVKEIPCGLLLVYWRLTAS